MKKKEDKDDKQASNLTFEEAMKKILHTPKEQVEKAIEKAKSDKQPKIR